MIRLNVSILSVCKTRRTNNRNFVSDRYRRRGDRGVGLILAQDMKKCVQGCCQLSDMILIVKLKLEPFNISVVGEYALTAQSTEEEIEEFYCTLDNTKAQCKPQEITIVIRDLNVRVGKFPTRIL